MLSPFAQQYLYSDRTTGSFTYDGFGNLTQQNVTAGSAPSMSLTVNPANNRVTRFGFYDANGNQIVAMTRWRLPIVSADSKDQLSRDSVQQVFAVCRPSLTENSRYNW